MIALGLLFFCGPVALSLAAEGPGGSVSQIPRLVYVGDPARLAVELGPGHSGLRGELIEDPLLLPAARDVEVLRAELENRQGRVRLLVDFRAYAPGRHELPPLRIGSLVFSTLAVEVASILDTEAAEGRGRNRVLSPAAPALAAPGTMVLVYGALAALVVLAAGIAGGRRFGSHFRRWLERRRRRRLFRRMGRSLRQFGDSLPGGGGEALEGLNREFRRFLSALTGEGCLAMVPGEFAALPDPGDGFGGPWLCGFFRRVDGLRFRGGDSDPGPVGALLAEARLFLDAAFRREEGPAGESAPGEASADAGATAGATAGAAAGATAGGFVGGRA